MKETLRRHAMQKFETLVSDNVSLAQASSTLRELKDLGISQSEAEEMLKSLRCDDETVDDIVLEILDIVVGWCQKEYRVW